MRRPVVVLVAVALAAFTPAACTSNDDRPRERPATTSKKSESPTTPSGRAARVERIVDGDTIVVGARETVRLIGIDTPETKDPRRPVQCFGEEATRHVTELVPPGTDVTLVRDVSAVDSFGRTLAYVYRSRDGLFVNADLVANGYAVAATFPPDVAHASEFVALERGARSAGLGLWSKCGGPGIPA